MRCKRRTTRLMAEQVPSQGSPKNRPPRISAPEATLLQNTTCGGSSGKEKKGNPLSRCERHDVASSHHARRGLHER